jgi:hypothetical protein
MNLRNPRRYCSVSSYCEEAAVSDQRDCPDTSPHNPGEETDPNEMARSNVRATDNV